MSRSFLVALIFMTVAGGAMRFQRLGNQSLWDDEAATLKGIATPTLADEVTFFRSHDPHPPLFFFQLRAWKAVFGSSLGTLRANSALWGTISIPLMYALAAFFAGPAVGLASAGLLTISPLHLAYSQELRPYALSIFLSMAIFLALGRLLRRDRGAVLLGMLWTLQLYAHYWGSFVCAASGFYGLAAAQSNRTRWKIVTAGAVALALFALWWPVLSAQLAGVNALSFWMPSASTMNLVKTFVAFTGLYFKVASKTFQALGPQWLLGSLAVLLGAVLLRGLWKGPAPMRWWLGIGLLLPWLLSYWKWGIFLWYRYTIHMYPAFLILLAVGALSLQRKRLRFGVLALVMGSQLLGLGYYFHGWQKANPKDVVAYIESIAAPGTRVIRPLYFSYLFDFYNQGKLETIDQHTLDSEVKREGLKRQPLILVSFDVPSDPIGEALRQRYPVKSSRTFSGFARLGITVYELQS